MSLEPHRHIQQLGALYENIADHEHNYFFDVSAAFNSFVTSSSESSEDDNPEPTPERVRRSRGVGSTRIEVAAAAAAAGESDDDGVFSDPAVLVSCIDKFCNIRSNGSRYRYTAHGLQVCWSVFEDAPGLKERSMKSRKELARGAANLS